MKIIDRVFLKLKEQNMKAVDLAGSLGIHKSVISNWKTRSTNPPSELIMPICNFLDVNPEYLLTGTQFKTSDTILELHKNELEYNLLNMFRQLDNRDKEDVFEIVKSKYERTINKDSRMSHYPAYVNISEKNKSDIKNEQDSDFA
ncbi:MAG: helix-turn-helix domain-containing protein [Filifactoraceae bacterium]